MTPASRLPRPAGRSLRSGRRESAGGNLAVELLTAGKTDGLPPPAAAPLLSPVTDLTLTGASIAGQAGRRLWG